MKNMERAYSAPGKVLLVGGYLVLDPKYDSYVVAVSSRMHAVVSEEKYNETLDGFHIQFTSPQFNNECWNYSVNSQNGYVPVEVSGNRNPFLEKTVLNVLSFIGPASGKTFPNVIKIDIYSDAGYHSQNNSITRSNGLKSFQFHKTGIAQVPKTGLGSSAGLVVVCTTALLSCFLNDNPLLDELDLIHNLSQLSHCQAQGKIGSGFDVAAAVYGSIKYRRFQPDLISRLPTLSSDNYREYRFEMSKLIKSNWNIKHESIVLPAGLRLVLGDVRGGSETVELVKKVKLWYTNNYPRSEEIYNNINEANLSFIDAMLQLQQLQKADNDKYKGLLKAINTGNDQQFKEILHLKAAIAKIRENFRLITQESGADIEPESQTKLLDACSQLNGVIGGVVPGAGGYDAVSIISTEDTNLNENTTSSEFDSVTWLDLKQEAVGLKLENPEYYRDLS